MMYSKGDRVVLSKALNDLTHRRPVSCRVVVDLGRSVVVCAEEEYERARSRGLFAQGVAYPKEDVGPDLSNLPELGMTLEMV